ncbi:IWR1 RNA polymerase II nuclear localization protein IWR1 [Candida maltosa Xu316]|uniref:Transcription factor Iwr1 domain-containing protein n=1 Tax=Candida maltosa (strain Xu316) TaxID=1245528 RepID=M3HJ14_CANMX|nr:hypothetical protein G210_2325 [Candida maltosa Xu316]
MFNQPPKILRIKRKRHQDPLQALILEDRRGVKRSKPSSPVSSPQLTPAATPSRIRSVENLNYIFKLARTDESDKVNAKDESIIQTILAESQTSSEESPFPENAKRNFVIPKHQTEEDIQIPHELSDMVDSFLTLEQSDTNKRRKRGHNGRRNTSEETRPAHLMTNDELEETQYVYDVYQLTDSEPLTTANHPQTQIGYIKFFDDDENQNLLMNDEEDENQPNALTDDEDSNAESFYQNDYPSDEDAGALSDKNSVTAAEEEEEDEGYVPHDGVGFDGDEEYYDYEELENLDNEDHYFDDDDEDDDNEFKRNQFFKSDVDDPMAIHRDKVFGKLERMINNK